MQTLLSRLLIFILLSLTAFATSAVSGKLVQPDTTAPGQSSEVHLDLQNCGGNYPIASGSSVTTHQLFQLSTVDGTWSGTLYRNDEISCNGSFTTWWHLTYWVNGRQVGPARDYVCSQASCAFDSMTPITTYPAPAPPQPPVSGARTFTFNQPTTASTWTMAHNFAITDVIASFYDLTGKQIYPDTVTETDLNTLTATFLSAQAGRALIINAGNFTPTTLNPNYIVSNPTSTQSIAGGFDFSLKGRLLPMDSNLWDLGSNTLQWRDGWFARNVNVGGMILPLVTNSSDLGSSTFLLRDGWFGRKLSVAGAGTFGSINLRCFADRYSGSDAGAKIVNAISDVNCQIIDATALTGAQTAASTITVSRSVLLLFGSVTLSVSTNPAINITVAGGSVQIAGIPGQSRIVNNTGANPGTGSAIIKADYSSGSQASDIQITGMYLDGGGNSSTTNAYRRGILMKNITRAFVDHNFITGIEAVPAGSDDAYGINFADKVTDSTITNNVINNLTNAANTDTGFRIPILVNSPLADSTNGVVSGIAASPVTTKRIVISNNEVSGGTHGINLQNVSDVRIIGNRAQSQIRNIIIYATTDHVVVDDNILKSATSSNLIFDYSIDHLDITNNIIDTNSGGEGSNIEGHGGITHVNISGNLLSNAATNGIYIASRAQWVTIYKNNIYNFCTVNAVGAGINIEGAQTNLFPALSAGGLINQIDIKGNYIYKDGQCPGATASFGVAILGKQTGTSQGNVAMTNIRIDDNTMDSMSIGIQTQKNGDTAAFSIDAGTNNLMRNLLVDPPVQAVDYNQVFTITGTAAPASGNWAVGSFVRNTAPTSTGVYGFVNTTAGSPGTWSNLSIGVIPNLRAASAAGCSTAATLNALCTTTITWGSAFADASYFVTCTGVGINTGDPLEGGISNLVAGSVDFKTRANSAVAASFSNIHCMANHP